MKISNDEVRRRAVDRWCQHDPLEEILAEAGCTARTLRSWIKKSGASRDAHDAPTAEGAIAVTRGHRYTQKQREEAVAMWLEDVPNTDICEAIGCSLRTLVYWTKGMTRDPQYFRHDAETRKAAVDAYVQGESCSSIAKRLGNGVVHSTVAGWVRAAGLELRASHSVNDASVASAFARLGSISAVARDLGHSPVAVRRSLQRSCLVVVGGVPSTTPP